MNEREGSSRDTRVSGFKLFFTIRTKTRKRHRVCIYTVNGEKCQMKTERIGMVTFKEYSVNDIVGDENDDLWKKHVSYLSVSKDAMKGCNDACLCLHCNCNDQTQ